MTIAGKKFLSFLIGLFLLTGLFYIKAPLEPASAATKLTVTLSCNLAQETIDSIVKNYIQKYNPDQIIIRYPDGTAKTYEPGGKTTVAPKPKQVVTKPAPKPVPAPKPTPAPKPVPAPKPTPAPKPVPASSILTEDEQKMFSLVNQERARAGLAPLKVNNELVKLARLKAQDMIKRNYFSHTSPTYGSPFEMMKSAGVTYRYAGENLAGANSVVIAHTNLMNSPGHRANILKANFSGVGIGVINGGPYGKMFVQLFIG